MRVLLSGKPGAVQSELVVLVPIESLEALEDFVVAANAARAAANEHQEVTAIPLIDGRLAPTWGVSGYTVMVNLIDSDLGWSARLNMPAFIPIASATFDSIAASAAALQSMDQLNLGIDGRPSAEIDVRAVLEVQLANGHDELRFMIAPFGTDISEAAATLLDEIRFGEVNYMVASHLAINGREVPELVQQVSLLRIMLDQAEINVAREMP